MILMIILMILTMIQMILMMIVMTLMMILMILMMILMVPHSLTLLNWPISNDFPLCSRLWTKRSESS